MAKTAEVSYSKETRQIEIVVPRGTKTAELSDLVKIVFGTGVIGGVHRPCTTCTSGDHLLIREALADVIQVDLDK